MRKFYILILALPILAFTLLYLSLWWFISAVGMLMLFIIYRIYADRLQASETRKEILEKELDDLHARLEQSVLKEQKATKETGQMRELKQQLLEVINHEIRTPMNGIMGMAQLLTDTPLTKDQQECINTIRSCGETLLTTVNTILVNDILDFSKLQQGETQLEYKNFDLRDSIEEVLELFADKTGKAGIELLYDIPEDVPTQIIGDSKRLRQVLMNLVENAVKFTQQGEIIVSVQRVSHNTPGYPPELNFEIRDTGIGIPKKQLNQLFTGIPVKELQPSNDNGSAGLGLVVCKKLVEFMGGHIEVTSEEGQGSSFTFRIPITPSLHEKRNHAHHDEMANLEGKRILVVDDNASARHILAKQLKTWKMLPVIAASGKQALDILLKNDAFDLVITDISMPEMDGIKLARLINDQYATLPVIGMSNAGYEKIHEGYQLFASILRKPTRQYLLREQIPGALFKNDSAKQNMTKPLTESFSQQYPLRILVAEDNIVNQKVAVKILTKLGYQPALANNGKEALEIVSHEQYDIILMDVQMPEMSGLEATRMIRTCLEAQPVIIALTANAMQGDRDECMQAGMDDYISKPIELKELLSQLEKWALAIKEKRKLSA